MRVLVLGGGPAGATAALKAAELGADVCLVERRRVGGTALNEGPAPVRTLARAARLVRDWSSWETFGLRGPRPEVDLAATLANADRVARHAHERKHMADHIRASGSTSWRRPATPASSMRTRSGPRMAGPGAQTDSSSPSAAAPHGCRSRAPSWR